MKARTSRLMAICGIAAIVLGGNIVVQAGDFTWAYETPMLHGKGDPAIAAIGDMIYTFGGHTEPWTWPYGRICEAYNTSTDTWSPIAHLPHGDGRYAMEAIAFNGKIYTFGGTNVGGNYNNDNIDEYDPATNTWIAYKARLGKRLSTVPLGEYGGKIYCFGGGLYQSSDWWSNDVYEYDPVANTVTTRTSMPTKKGSACAATVGDKIYVIGGFGGYNASDPLDVVERYDPLTDTWATGFAPIPTGGDVGCGVIDGKIYVNAFRTTEVYEYDPATDIWTPKNPIQTARAGQGVVAVGNKLYVMGGYIPGHITPLVEEGTLTIDAVIDIDPDALDLSSKDKWVTCYIEFPNGYDVVDIDGSTVMLEGIHAYIGTDGWARAGANSGNIMDHDGDGIRERMVKFDRSAVRDYLIGLGVSGYVSLKVAGDLVDGPSFEGTDVIRVTNGGN